MDYSEFPGAQAQVCSHTTRNTVSPTSRFYWGRRSTGSRGTWRCSSGAGRQDTSVRRCPSRGAGSGPSPVLGRVAGTWSGPFGGSCGGSHGWRSLWRWPTLQVREGNMKVSCPGPYVNQGCSTELAPSWSPSHSPSCLISFPTKQLLYAEST